MPSGFQEIVASPDAKLANPIGNARLPRFIGSPSDTQKNLDKLNIAIVGVGAIGGMAGLSLARLQPKSMQLVDSGSYKPESVLTQQIARGAIGESKAIYMGSLYKEISPSTEVHVSSSSIQELPLDAFAQCDVILLCTDNLAAEVETNRRALLLRKPLFQGSLHGESLIAQVRVLLNDSDEGPCLVCQFGARELLELDRETIFSCEGNGIDLKTHHQATMCPSPLPGIGGDLLAMTVLRFALSLGVPLQSSIIEFCGFTNKMTTSTLIAKADCYQDHHSATLIDKNFDPSRLSLGELLSCAHCAHDNPLASIELLGHVFVERASCGCSPDRTLMRFHQSSEPAHTCWRCSSSLLAHPYSTHAAVSTSRIKPMLNRTLKELGASHAELALIRDDTGSVLIRMSSR